MKSKEQKRQEAQERQAKYDKLTSQEKLAKLDKSGFAAKRERARIERGLNHE